MKRTPRKRRSPRLGAVRPALPKTYLPILRLWTLRLIHLAGGPLPVRGPRPDLGREAFELAGLQPFEVRHREADEVGAARAVADFEGALAKAETAAPSLPTHSALAQNLEWLAVSAGLNAVDRDILHFTVLAALHPGFENALEHIGNLSSGALQSLIARVLRLPPGAVARSLDTTGALSRTGLLQVDSSRNYSFMSKVELLPALADRLTLRSGNPMTLFSSAFVPAGKATLSLDRYPHLAKDLAILVPYLRGALRNPRKGVNILIHGTPGTGKTELVRALAIHLDATLLEVASTLPDGSPVEGGDRFRGYRLAQAVVGRQRNHLIFFDEVEDVFRVREDAPRSFRNNESGRKAWVNRVLEENPTPAFWVTNHLHVLDPAFLRRFDYVLHLETPPRTVRRRMLEDHLGSLPVGATQLTRLAEHEGLSPALIARAVKVVGAVHRVEPTADSGQVLAHVLGNSLEAMGHDRLPRQAAEQLTPYRPEVVNVDFDLAPTLEGLRRHGRGRLCFYGPPGTGKTAYGRHLAEALDRPLLVKRASDLLSMWVGGTEKALARMFEEARAENAVLLLDEADSFLQDRSESRQSWEVTQVNEMLTQMEAFPGVFIASTNLMDRLDSAALRRFDAKVKFGYLRPEQAWRLFQDAAEKLGIPADPALASSLGAFRVLTPGDFATVLRQARLNHPTDGQTLLARLESECRSKPEAWRRPLGFTERVP